MNTTSDTLELPASLARKQPRVEPIWRLVDVQPLCGSALDTDGDQEATPVSTLETIDNSLVRLAYTRLCETGGQQRAAARLLRVWGTD